MNDIIVAAASMRCLEGDIQGNLGKIDRLARLAQQQRAGILCLPEMCVTGYFWDGRAGRYAEPVPGRSTDALIKLATRYQIIILAGLPERDEAGKRYVSHVVATPTGIAGVYRKTHLGPPEKDTFTPGGALPVFCIPGMRFGIQLCYDGHFPEASLLLALQGAEVLFMPHASPGETPAGKRERMLRYLPARAYDTTCYVVMCNQVGVRVDGRPFAGVAMILDPKGRVLAEAYSWKEELITARLEGQELERLRGSRMGYFLPDRRAELYLEMTKSLSAQPETGTEMPH